MNCRSSVESDQRTSTPGVEFDPGLAGREPADWPAASRIEAARSWFGRLHGTAGARNAILAGVLVSPTRVDVALPFRVPADLDQISIVGIQQ